MMSDVIPPPRLPYTGTTRKLVLAFDIGTTFSGVSYCILDPGIVPEIKGVNRYPAQVNNGGSSKIPTIIFYDEDGNVRACGAEATSEIVQDQAEEEGWVKAEWFKLHLRPNAKGSASVTSTIPPLPPRKTAVDVIADFLRYLFQCTKTYIWETHANGKLLWESVEDEIDFVLSHPNGWEGAQQADMRRAALRAGLIKSLSDDMDRIQFVTEGEASLHFCVHSGLANDGLQGTDGVLIVDAGGGTVDLSAYARSSSNDLKTQKYEEIAMPQCHLKGSIFVSKKARDYLQETLRTSAFVREIDGMMQAFDTSTKLRFRDTKEPSFVKFGSRNDTDVSLGIRHGQMRIPGTAMASFFEPSIACIISAIKKQAASARKPVKTVLLVGGFAASDWLFKQLQTALDPLGLSFSRPDGHVNKAVSDGAVWFYLQRAVTTRVSRFFFGIDCRTPYQPSSAAHKLRVATRFKHPIDGYHYLPGAFSSILSKDVQIHETEEFKCQYIQLCSQPAHFGIVETEILCYRGLDKNPEWIDVDADYYTTLCTVSADMSAQRRTLCKITPSANGGHHYSVEFEIIILFGLTEMKAQIAWKDGLGGEKRSPARIVFEPY